MTEKVVGLQWYRALKNDEKEEFKHKVLQSEEVLIQLHKIVKDKVDAARTQQLAISRFMEPAWSERQADLNGYQRALIEICDLINLER